VWLPRLPTDRLRSCRSGKSPEGRSPESGSPEGRSEDRSPEGRPPEAVVGRRGNALVLVAVDAAAAARGLAPGLPLADARARVPDLAVAPEDAAGDRAALERLADVLDRYTPLVALAPPDALLLDIVGCAHLFGGEAGVLADLRPRLARLGLAARLAVADGPGAALALARFGPEGAAHGTAALMPLPVAALRLAPEAAAGLARLGLATIGALAGQPRAPVARRFGREVLLRLDQALGRVEEPISPRLPAPALVAERRFAEPVADAASLERGLAALLQALAGLLERRGEGVRRLGLSLFLADGTPVRTAVGTSRPSRAPARLFELFAPALERLPELDPAGAGFELMRLAALETGPLDAAQIDLAGRGAAEDGLARLVDRLAARLGAEAVARLAPVDSHRPEAAAMRVPPAAAADWDGEPGPVPGEPPERPLRLLARPEPIEAVAMVPDGPPLRFRWRRAFYEVGRAEGPERIGAEWWKAGAAAPTRDYFRVEDTAGRRFWLYRDGLLGIETDRARWFLHGLFG
jgi:protein ImuB